MLQEDQESGLASPHTQHYDDSLWETVQVPHDWAMGLGFDKSQSKTKGYRRIGGRSPENSVGWYRKTFTASVRQGCRYMLEFEGIFRDAQVWVNGIYQGRGGSGYAPLSFDVTESLNEGDQSQNVITVRVDATHSELWSYEGAGIYRNVWLTQTAGVHVAKHGTYIVSDVDLKHKSAKVKIKTELINNTAEQTAVAVRQTILNAEGQKMATIESRASLSPMEHRIVEQNLDLNHAELWDLDNPYLYKLKTVLSTDGKEMDTYTTRFGVRTACFDADGGFFLNGRRVQIQGMCCHQDHAGVGVAVPDELNVWRISRLKEFGVNAYRASHNPPTPAILEACDSLGMLVMDEMRMMAASDEGLEQMRTIVRRDRNHPSIIIWSLGNEEPSLQCNETGRRIVHRMREVLRTLDSTRPCTAAMNGGWGNGEGVTLAVDVQGCNYMRIGDMDDLHRRFPQLPCLLSEEASTLTTRGIYKTDTARDYHTSYDSDHPGWGATAQEWLRFVDARPYIAGGFVWTGFDYGGEALGYYWPGIASNFGVLDYCGYPKDAAWYYKANWTDSPVLHILPHWNGTGTDSVDVQLYTNMEEVELRLNGKSLGKKHVGRYDIPTWRVRYVPGKLVAEGKRKGHSYTATMETTGKPWAVQLVDENYDKKSRLKVVTARIVDKQGRVVPDASNYITFEVSGGRVLGVGNGDPSCHEPDVFAPGKPIGRSAFSGLAQLLVYTDNEGSARVKAHAQGLVPDSMTWKGESLVTEEGKGIPEDDFCKTYRPLLTAHWTEPIGVSESITDDAPKGPYMGNGEVGVVAYATKSSQTLRLSKVNFVTDGKADWAGDGAAALPAGEVQIKVKSNETDGLHYEMDQIKAQLRMRTGTDQPVEMVSWMTMDDNIVVTEVRNLSQHDVDVEVSSRGLPSADYITEHRIKDDVTQMSRRSLATDKVRWISKVGWSVRVVGAPSQTRLSGNGISEGRLVTVPAGGSVHVLTCISGGGKHDDAKWDEACHKLKKISAGSLQAMRRKHDEWWREMWTRSWVETGDALLQRQYLSSIYLMASAYSPRTTACGGMYGVWNMTDNMKYHGDIHLNYNSQAGFYSMFSANRPELALPYYDFLERMIPEGRRRAREEMGKVHPSLQGKSCRGILFPVSALGIGEFYGEYWQQTMDAPFNVCLYNWYYEYTQDEKFLRERAYPFLRECGDFYEDYLVREQKGNTYRYSITTGGHEGSWDLNPPSDLALVEQTFRLLLRYSKQLGIDADRRTLWHDIVTHLPEYAVTMPKSQPNAGQPVYAKNEAGWDLPAHLIQLHCLYPCELMNLGSNPEALQLARNTIQYYGVDQQGFTETMNELGLSAFVMGARAGFSPYILLDKIKVLASRAEPNFMIRDENHCLEKTAVVETINSMMLQSVDGILHLFPNWTSTPASFTRLRAKGAYLVSACYNGHHVERPEICSEQGGECRIRTPWKGCKAMVLCQGKSTIIEEKDSVLHIPTKKGQKYSILPI